MNIIIMAMTAYSTSTPNPMRTHSTRIAKPSGISDMSQPCTQLVTTLKSNICFYYLVSG